MHGLAALPADELDSPAAAGREAALALEAIRAILRRIELLAAERPDDRLLVAGLRATEAAVAAEQLAAREIIVEQIKQEWFARGRTSMAREVAASQRLRPVV